MSVGAGEDEVDPLSSSDAATLTDRHWALSVKLDPTNEQRTTLAMTAGARRFAYNELLSAVVANHQEWSRQREDGVEKADRVRPHTRTSLRAHWKAHAPSWWPGVVAYSVMTRSLDDVLSADANFLAGRARFPRFAKKNQGRERFTVRAEDAVLEAGRVRLALIGWVRIASTDPRQAQLRRLLRRGRARVLSTTVSRHSDGSWWIALSVAQPSRPPAPHPRAGAPVVGVDRGVTTSAVAVDSTGANVEQLPSVRSLRDAQHALARAQRVLARRTVRGKASSANRERAKRRVGVLHTRVRRRREAVLHAYSAQLTTEHPTIVLETLATREMMGDRRLAQAIGDQGWAELARQVRCKASRKGGEVLAPERWFPSSKTCAQCGAARATLPLTERVYRCDSCGHSRDRDENAALTLARWGEHVLSCPECTAQHRDPDSPGRRGAQHQACGGWVRDLPAFAGGPEPLVEAGTSQPARA